MEDGVPFGRCVALLALLSATTHIKCNEFRLYVRLQRGVGIVSDSACAVMTTMWMFCGRRVVLNFPFWFPPIVLVAIAVYNLKKAFMMIKVLLVISLVVKVTLQEER